MKERVAVTGGSGFIGSHLVDQLIEAGYEVLVIDHRVRPHREDVDFADVDIVNFSTVLNATRGCDYVFHLAAVANVNYAFSQPLYTVEANVLGTTNILEAARHNGIKRVFFASTVWVYSGCRDGNVCEDSPLDFSGAGHVYTSSKIASEFFINDYWRLYKVPFTILRYGIPYGPRMREELVIPIFIKKALFGEPITIAGDGSQYRNFIYIDDLIKAHILAMNEKAKNQVYNLEGKRRITIREIAETLKEILGNDVKIECVPARPGDYFGKEVSAEKAKRELGWEPQIDFKEGMRRTIEWFKNKWTE